MLKQWLSKLLPGSSKLPQIRTKITAIESLFGGIPLSRFFNFEQFLQAGSGKVWAAWKSCDLIGNIVMDTPFVTRRKGKTTETINTELQKLLKNPNPFENFSEQLYKLIFHLKLTGNGFHLKDEPNNNGDMPSALYVLNPKRMRFVVSRTFGPQGYIYSSQIGGEIPLELEEVIHYRRPHPNREFWGLGEIEAGQALFNENQNHSTWSEKFWKNGAAPSGVMILEDSETMGMRDNTEWQRMKLLFEKEYGGIENVGKQRWLSGKWRYEQLGLSMTDMQDLERSKLNVEQIFSLMGIPLSVVGQRDAANYNTASIADVQFRGYTVKPMVKLIQDSLNSDLVQGFDPNLELIFNLSGLKDVGKTMQDFSPLFDRGGISVNEMRIEAGLPPIDDPQFDQHYISAGMLPLELAGIADQGQTQQQAQAIVSRFLQDSVTRRNGEHARIDS